MGVVSTAVCAGGTDNLLSMTENRKPVKKSAGIGYPESGSIALYHQPQGKIAARLNMLRNVLSRAVDETPHLFFHRFNKGIGRGLAVLRTNFDVPADLILVNYADNFEALVLNLCL